eukprot:1307858-Rhodomonas_salina.3
MLLQYNLYRECGVQPLISRPTRRRYASRRRLKVAFLPFCWAIRTIHVGIPRDPGVEVQALSDWIAHALCTRVFLRYQAAHRVL